MNRDFIEALATREPLTPVRDRLIDIETATHKKVLDQITEDFETGRDILRGIMEPEGSFPHRWAEAYLQEARAQMDAKDADEQERITARNAAEIEYWAKVKASSQHSTK